VTADWPDDSDTVAEAKEHPGVFAQKGVGDIADHVQAVIDLAKGGPSGDRRALRIGIAPRLPRGPGSI
jgi:hypothetical protein